MTSILQKKTECKTALNLTRENKRRLSGFSEEARDRFVNEALANTFGGVSQNDLKYELLESLKNSNTVPSNGVTTQDVVRKIREKETANLISSV